MRAPFVVSVLAVTSMLTVAAFAAPMKVKTAGVKSQVVVMCPDCQSKASCARVGDYVISLNVDVDNPKLGTGKIVVHVQDAGKKPLTDATVAVTVSMPEHKHGGRAQVAKHTGHGAYVVTTNRLNMSGGYRADVAVTPSGGDTIKQAFSFAK